jgi:hypothetical protein
VSPKYPEIVGQRHTRSFWFTVLLERNLREVSGNCPPIQELGRKHFWEFGLI